MSGYWYEEQGPNTEDVRKKLTEEYIMPKYKYRLIKLNTIKKIIDDVILVEEKQHKGWGSYRGYWTFTHKKLIKKINKQVQTVMETNAYNKINHFVINSPWVQNLFYRPPTDTKPAGRMYGSVLSRFNQMTSSENTPKQYLSEI